MTQLCTIDGCSREAEHKVECKEPPPRRTEYCCRECVKPYNDTELGRIAFQVSGLEGEKNA